MLIRRLATLSLLTAVLSAPEGDTSGGGGNATAPPLPPPAADESAKLAAALAATQAELKAIRGAQAKADADRKAAEEKALGEQGQFRTLAEQKAAEAEELRKKIADLEGDAAIGRTYREQKQAEIEAASKGLTADDKAILDALPTVDAKAKFLARISTTTTTPAAKPAPGSTAPPPGGNEPTIEQLITTRGVDWVVANKPKEWSEYASRHTSSTGRPRGLFG
jgi:hypothetical protein